MAGAEVPPQGTTPPAHSQYPPRDQGQRLPSAGKQPAPIQTSPPPQQQGYAPYSQQPSAPNHGPRPQSTYNNPQELSTSVYDSPVAPHNPNSAATYSSSVYSPDNDFGASSPSHPGGPSGPPGGGPPGGYQPYTAYHPSAPGDAPPPPTGAAPPVPGSNTRPGPGNVMTPPPLHPSGPAYDARQTLPSRTGDTPQYKAYVPPGAAAAGGEAPSAPGDYYRSASGVSY
jgi:signal transducing adaptor molecule